ncbi:MAG: hypothetical protein N3D11_15160 [Candidatus Sumerlaeia bacterium]|nr:hypothetical protein [Candidatus Sumerlaeia bacterium]
MPNRWPPITRRAALCIGALLVLLTALPAFGDPYEPDNTWQTARRVVVNGPAERRDFLTATDQDWILFYCNGTSPYTIETTAVSSLCDVAIAVFRSDGVTMVTPPGEVDWEGLGRNETITLLNPPKGFYYARFRNADPTHYGPGSFYRLQVKEPVGAGLPIETLDERAIGIQKSTSPGAAGPRATAVLTPGTNPLRDYHRHRIEFPGYTETALGTAMDVRIKTAYETEKYGLPGQVFPWKSRALFVIEVVRWTAGTSTPMAFTDPVNLTVEFAPYTAPTPFWNDVVTFAADAGTSPRMAIVRDMAEGSAVSFQFLGGTHEVNLAQRTVTIRNYVGLTGSSGQATYGAVVRQSTAARHWELYP